MLIRVNNNIYAAVITGCGEAITLFDESGKKITVIPSEENWEDLASTAISAINRTKERAQLIAA
jgi:hypothetical protein